MTIKKQKHLYPHKIAQQALKLLQGILFYDILSDTAAGIYIRSAQNPENKIKEYLINIAGWSKENYEISWTCLENYIKEFQSPIHQHTVISMISQWDWFISKIGRFINYAEKFIKPEIEIDKGLRQLNLKPFNKQIETIENTTGIQFDGQGERILLIDELHLIRNLGLHNNWEVDEGYLSKTYKRCYKKGEKRLFDINELTGWYDAFVKLIGVIANETATRYANVPDYEE